MSDTQPITPDPTDPHGFHTADTHGHVILSQRLLLGVFGVLVVLTLLTVAASRAEVWIGDAFDYEIPQSINVFIAMSIALVKGTMVALIFMQLWFDNKLNAMILLFSLLVFALFIGFTSLDMMGRDDIDRFKAGEINAGGLGNVVVMAIGPDGTRQRVTVPAGMSLVDFVKQNAAEHGGPEHAEGDEYEIPLSSPDLSLPAYGLRLFAPDEPSHDPDQPTPEHNAPDEED